MSIFSDRLKQLRDASGKTQAQIAESIGVTPQAFSYYINGREPNYDILIEISNYFNVSIDFLLGKSEFRNHAEKSRVDATFQEFIDLFSAYDPNMLDILIKNIVIFLRLSDSVAKKSIIWNIVLLTGFHRRILDIYQKYILSAKSFGTALTNNNPPQLDLKGYVFPGSSSEEICYLVQNSFNSQALEEAAYIYEETQKMIEALYSEICAQNGLWEKFGERYRFKLPRAAHYPDILDIIESNLTEENRDN